MLRAPALLLAAVSATAQSPATFERAKAMLAGIHEGMWHLKTLHWACRYARTGRMGDDIDPEVCGLEARIVPLR